MTTDLDPRVVRSRKALQEALIALIPEQGYEAITVRDITARAGLNRGTFYLHYDDKDALLEAAYERLIEGSSPAAGTDGDAPIMHILAHVEAHADFYRVMLAQEGIAAERLQAAADRLVRRWMAYLDTESPLDEAIVMRYISAACIGVIRGWLADDMAQPPDVIASHLRLLTERVLG